MGGGADGGGGDGGGGEGDGGGGDGGNGGGCGGGKYSRGPQSSQSVPRLHCAPFASACPSWQKLLLMNCSPPFPKELRQVLSQSFGGGGEDGGENAALVMLTNASSIAMSLPKGWGGCQVRTVMRCAPCTVLC